MRLIIIDGQGGGMGRALTERLRAASPEAEIVAVGTNVLATAAMLKAGASAGATGENAVRVNCRRADVIAGPIGIVLADALLGEITPEMARCVAASPARKVLLPMQKCHIQVAGVAPLTTQELVEDAVRRILEGQKQ